MMILILSICLGAAISGYAGSSAEVLIPLTHEQSIGQGSDEYDLNHKPVALLTHSLSRRITSVSHRHLNYSRFVDFLWTAVSAKQPDLLQDFYQPVLYFKPIGLKLVFPEHYFW